MTGNRPLPSLRYPSYGAVVSKEMESLKELPAFVAVPNQGNYPDRLYRRRIRSV